LLVDAVDEMLLVQRGRELGRGMSDEQFASIVDNLRNDNPGLETDDQFEVALKQEGMTMTDLRRMFERQVITSSVQQLEILPKVSVTEEEARRYFDSHPNEFKAEPGLTLREILIRVPEQAGGINVGLDEEAKARIEALRERALKGEAFETLAAEHSDAGSKANGGLVGPLKREELAPTFQELIDPLEPGQVSEVVRSRQGYQLFRLESRTETDQLTFEQARAQIGETVGEQKRVVELARYLDMLRRQAAIEWRNDELKKAYEQGLELRAKQLAPAAEPGA
jgi:parvulin-like peptidyl-prolyl isomerase